MKRMHHPKRLQTNTQTVLFLSEKRDANGGSVSENVFGILLSRAELFCIWPKIHVIYISSRYQLRINRIVQSSPNKEIKNCSNKNTLIKSYETNLAISLESSAWKKWSSPILVSLYLIISLIKTSK